MKKDKRISENFIRKPTLAMDSKQPVMNIQTVLFEDAYLFAKVPEIPNYNYTLLTQTTTA